MARSHKAKATAGLDRREGMGEHFLAISGSKTRKSMPVSAGFAAKKSGLDPSPCLDILE
jgi:hypothetical protein